MLWQAFYTWRAARILRPVAFGSCVTVRSGPRMALVLQSWGSRSQQMRRLGVLFAVQGMRRASQVILRWRLRALDLVGPLWAGDSCARASAVACRRRVRSSPSHVRHGGSSALPGAGG